MSTLDAALAKFLEQLSKLFAVVDYDDVYKTGSRCERLWLLAAAELVVSDAAFRTRCQQLSAIADIAALAGAVYAKAQKINTDAHVGALITNQSTWVLGKKFRQGILPDNVQSLCGELTATATTLEAILIQATLAAPSLPQSLAIIKQACTRDQSSRQVDTPVNHQFSKEVTPIVGVLVGVAAIVAIALLTATPAAWAFLAGLAVGLLAGIAVRIVGSLIERKIFANKVEQAWQAIPSNLENIFNRNVVQKTVPRPPVDINPHSQAALSTPARDASFTAAVIANDSRQTAAKPSAVPDTNISPTRSPRFKKE